MIRLVPFLLVLAPACRKPAPEVAPPAPVAACGLLPDGARVFRILHLNDIYRIEGLADGRGGIARVRTLRTELERDCPGAVLVTHAGDALYPSLHSRVFGGEQMIDALNLLDGAPDQVDPLMWFTPGNHEFDKAAMKHAPGLRARIDQSEFGWLDTNIAWAEVDGQPAIASERLAARALLDVGGVKVGLFGLTTDAKIPEYTAFIDTDHAGVARTQTAELREAGAEVVIGLTHLGAAQDLALVDTLAADGPDVVVGGHDHSLMTGSAAGRYVVKGDADAARVRVIEVRVAADGAVTVTPDDGGVPLGPDAPAPDPAVKAAVDDWIRKFDAKFCEKEGPGCLGEVYTRAAVDLHAEETTIRRFETNVGAWIADRMVETFAADGAEVAFVNSGALRLNQDLSAGTPITRQTLEELFAYPAAMSLVAIPGSTLQAVLDRSVEEWTASGHWLQVSGVAFRHDPVARTATDAHVFDAAAGAWRPLDPKRTYKAVTVRYVLDPGMGDQDGYRMLSLDQVVRSASDGADLKPIVRDALKAMGDAGFAPVAPGRVCNPQRPGACVLDDPR